jgi:flagella basal body P-ring formation protein FlgA
MKVLALLLLIFSTVNAKEVKIIISPEARVQDPYRISLGEIASIECNGINECDSLRYLPVHSEKGFVSKYSILSALRLKGYKARITGKVSKIIYSRGGAILKELTAAIKTYVKTKCEYRNPNVEVRILNVNNEILGGLEKINGRFSVSAPLWNCLSGNVRFSAGKSETSVLASVGITADVIVASKDIPIFTDIKKDKVKYSRKKIDSNSYVDSIKGAVGKRSRCYIMAGHALNTSCIEESPLVSRGEIVNLVVSLNGVTIKSPAKSMQNGKLGEYIRVRNLQTKKIIQAKVTGARKLEVSLY